MATDIKATAAERQNWISRLEIERRVKSQLLDALYRGDDEEVLSLLASGKVDSKHIRSNEHKNLPTGLTALHLASLFGDQAVVTRLLEINANPKVTCYSQITSHSIATKFWMDARPLLFAIGAKNQSIVQQLVDHGAPITMDDAWPLFSAEWWALTGRFDWTGARAILEYLIVHKLNVNGRAAKLRWTLLHYCINMEPRSLIGAREFLRERHETVSFLLDNGADPLVRDTFGRTPYALLDSRASNAAQDTRDPELQRAKLEADQKLKVLLQETMAKRIAAVKQTPGLKGTMQRALLRGQNSDRLPLLLRSGASSLRRFSTASSTDVSRYEEVAGKA